jgi:polar amino acid transport system substrate-binding protein
VTPKNSSELEVAARDELTPSGRLRAAINLENPILVQRNAATGALSGVSVELALKLASELGVEVELVQFNTAGKTFEALAAGDCDVGFLAIDPIRAARLSYTAPYVLIHGSYLARSDSRFKTTGDVDEPAVRIAAGRNTAYDLYLSRTLKHAQLVYASDSVGAIELLLAGDVEVAAGIHQPLAQIAKDRPDFKMVDGHFMVIQQAMTVQKERTLALAYLCHFIEQLKSSGFVAAALQRSGQDQAQIAPPVHLT